MLLKSCDEENNVSCLLLWVSEHKFKYVHIYFNTLHIQVVFSVFLTQIFIKSSMSNSWQWKNIISFNFWLMYRINLIHSIQSIFKRLGQPLNPHFYLQLGKYRIFSTVSMKFQIAQHIAFRKLHLSLWQCLCCCFALWYIWSSLSFHLTLVAFGSTKRCCEKC